MQEESIFHMFIARGRKRLLYCASLLIIFEFFVIIICCYSLIFIVLTAVAISPIHAIVISIPYGIPISIESIL